MQDGKPPAPHPTQAPNPPARSDPAQPTLFRR